ncbi:MAG: hypothetical protein HYT48_01805, partial [Candidatus Vogelbacteria bacterium]|nr:hypothetical protein [Candidatus Vogelbacteria bacterium]
MSNVQLVRFYMQQLAKKSVTPYCRQFYKREFQYYLGLIRQSEVERFSGIQKRWLARAKKLFT